MISREENGELLGYERMGRWRDTGLVRGMER